MRAAGSRSADISGPDTVRSSSGAVFRLSSSMSTYQATRLQHQASALEQLPRHLAALTWSREQLREHRQQRLRRLLALACERSPWHRRRLAHLDLARIDEADLSAVPPMT